MLTHTVLGAGIGGPDGTADAAFRNGDRGFWLLLQSIFKSPKHQLSGLQRLLQRPLTLPPSARTSKSDLQPRRPLPQSSYARHLPLVCHASPRIPLCRHAFSTPTLLAFSFRLPCRRVSFNARGVIYAIIWPGREVVPFHERQGFPFAIVTWAPPSPQKTSFAPVERIGGGRACRQACRVLCGERLFVRGCVVEVIGIA